MKVRLTVVAVLASLSIAGSAAAQQTWLSDRRYGEGIGIRTGNLELHPGISTEFGYDSNFFQRYEDELGGVDDAWRLRITPSLSLSTLSDQRKQGEGKSAPPALKFDANAFFAYSELFGVDDQPTGDKFNRTFSAGVGGLMEIAPERPVGAEVSANYLRSGEPSNSPFLDQAFNRSTTTAAAAVIWRPGGGLLDWRLGYEFGYNAFEENAYDELNNFQHSIVTQGRWRFLPRTALRFDGRYTMIRYQVNEPQVDGDFIEARIGAAGLITSQLSFLAMFGWNASFYEAGPGEVPGETITPQNYDDPVAHVELKWFTSPTADPNSAPAGLSSVAAGYLRDFSNSYLGTFYTRDRGYLKADYFLGGVFLAQLEAGFAHYRFPESGTQFRNPSFTQNRVDAKLFGEYRLSDTLGLNLTLQYDQALQPSDSLDPRGVQVDATNFDDLRYSRFQAMLGLRLFW